MPSLKLSILASVYAPYKFARKTISSSSSSSTTTAVLPRPLNCRQYRFRPPGWKITPCAPLTNLAHDNRSPSFGNNLGFRGQKLFSVSSEERGSDMCSENKGDQWPPPEETLTNNHHYNHRQPEKHRQNSAKLLTLPTILTIGRVASVPLLVGSTSITHLLFSFRFDPFYFLVKKFDSV